MSEFKRGDLVVRTGPSTGGIKQGKTYTVSYCCGADLTLLEVSGFWLTSRFESAEVEDFSLEFTI